MNATRICVQVASAMPLDIAEETYINYLFGFNGMLQESLEIICHAHSGNGIYLFIPR
jgi:hypothetical protein